MKIKVVVGLLYLIEYFYFVNGNYLIDSSDLRVHHVSNQWLV
jgi:hypothetical protein